MKSNTKTTNRIHHTHTHTMYQKAHKAFFCRAQSTISARTVLSHGSSLMAYGTYTRSLVVYEAKSLSLTSAGCGSHEAVACCVRTLVCVCVCASALYCCWPAYYVKKSKDVAFSYYQPQKCFRFRIRSDIRARPTENSPTGIWQFYIWISGCIRNDLPQPIPSSSSLV